VRTLTVAALAALVAASLGAESGTRFRLSLIDDSGVALSGVEVSVVGLDTGKVVTVRSDESGLVEATLDDGDYAIDLGRSGATVTDGPRLVRIRSGQATHAVLRIERQAPDPSPNQYSWNGSFSDDDHSFWSHHHPKDCSRGRRHHPHPCPVSPSH
jgi:hypothetical protein